MSEQYNDDFSVDYDVEDDDFAQQQPRVARETMRARFPRELGWAAPDEPVDLCQGQTLAQWLSCEPEVLWTLRYYVLRNDDAGEMPYQLMSSAFNVKRATLPAARAQLEAQVDALIETQVVELARLGQLERQASYAVSTMATLEPQPQGHIDRAAMQADVSAHIGEDLRAHARQVPMSARADESGESAAAAVAFAQMQMEMQSAGIKVPQPSDYTSAGDYAEDFLQALRAFVATRGYATIAQDPLIRQVGKVIARDADVNTMMARLAALGGDMNQLAEETALRERYKREHPTPPTRRLDLN